MSWDSGNNPKLITCRHFRLLQIILCFTLSLCSFSSLRLADGDGSQGLVETSQTTFTALPCPGRDTRRTTWVNGVGNPEGHGGYVTGKVWAREQKI